MPHLVAEKELVHSERGVSGEAPGKRQGRSGAPQAACGAQEEDIAS